MDPVKRRPQKESCEALFSFWDDRGSPVGAKLRARSPRLLPAGTLDNIYQAATDGGTRRACARTWANLVGHVRHQRRAPFLLARSALSLVVTLGL
jgi:hypothetical protein